MIQTKDLLDIIDRDMPLIIDLVKDIGEHPELGYKEFRTSGYVNEFLHLSGYTTETNLAITGVKAKLKKQSEGPNIAFVAELDGIPCPESNFADKETGATHCCGHNIQLGVMMAVAHAFKESGIGSELGGNISFIAAPAEEYIELEYLNDKWVKIFSSILLVVSTCIAVLFNTNPIQLLIMAQATTCFGYPLVIIMIFLLSNNKKVMREYKNSIITNIILGLAILWVLFLSFRQLYSIISV
jgi:Metal-dependent amidase/aminoacylase/carboxypeptidase